MAIRFHREGHRIIWVSTLVLLVLCLLVGQFGFLPFWLAFGVALLTLGFVLQFFRHPKRTIPEKQASWVYAPADGKVVVVEPTHEPEYFQDQRIQISIFMSPLNVHVNRNPVSGEVLHKTYHPGKYLVAWHPKSSLENERTTVVYGNEHGKVLVRQIAGAVARRIINYLQTGQTVAQGTEMGFIRFGSRVDVLLPLNAEVLVEPGDRVKGNLTLLAKLK